MIEQFTHIWEITFSPETFGTELKLSTTLVGTIKLNLSTDWIIDGVEGMNWGFGYVNVFFFLLSRKERDAIM